MLWLAPAMVLSANSPQPTFKIGCTEYTGFTDQQWGLVVSHLRQKTG